ncbi:MAG TPA: 30S ribosomal protein THX [Chitinophagales bacterium]|nr:30S ribosomal protein THX [Chitinophagales bacterium]
MGKGDRRTRRGKIFRGSFGNPRPHRVKKKKTAPVTAAPVSIATAETEEPRKKAAPRKKKKESEA